MLRAKKIGKLIVRENGHVCMQHVHIFPSTSKGYVRACALYGTVEHRGWCALYVPNLFLASTSGRLLSTLTQGFSKTI